VIINELVQFFSIKFNASLREFIKFYPKKRLKQLVRQIKYIEIEKDNKVAIAMFCGSKELYEGIASLLSFYYFSDIKYPLYWFDDGTLSKNQIKIIYSKFTNATVISHHEGDKDVVDWLKANSLNSLLNIRKNLIFGRRLTDINFFLHEKHVLLLDSDVLFLNYPEVLLTGLADVAKGFSPKWLYNIDVRESYCTSTENIKASTGIDIIRDFNTGLFFFESSRQNLFQMEKINQSGLLVDHIYYWEQTLFALLTTLHSGIPLPEDYDVHYRYAQKTDPKYLNAKSRHYCSDSRISFYYDFENYLLPKHE